MSPQNWLCRSERNPALDTLAPISPLVHINEDNAYSPQIPDTKLTVTSKVQFLELKHVFCQNPTNKILHTSDDTRCHLNLLNFLLTHNLLNTSFAALKANPIFHAANKNLLIKTPFDNRHLTSSSSSFYFLTTISERLTTLSEEPTQRKHTYVTTILVATNKPTSPAKIILQKLWPQNGSPSLNNNNHFNSGYNF